MKFLEVTCTSIRHQTKKNFMKKHAERYAFPPFSSHWVRGGDSYSCWNVFLTRSNLFSFDVISLKLFIYTTV